MGCFSLLCLPCLISLFDGLFAYSFDCLLVCWFVCFFLGLVRLTKRVGGCLKTCLFVCVAAWFVCLPALFLAARGVVVSLCS